MPKKWMLSDPVVAAEIAAAIDSGRELPRAKEWNISSDAIRGWLNGERADDVWTEAVIRAYARPVVRIRSGRMQPVASPEVRRRLRLSAGAVEQRLRAVGRLVMENHPRRRTAGTAWLCAPSLVMTTSLVAADFVAAGASASARRRALDGADIETFVELDGSAGAVLRLRIEEVVHLDDEIAVLRIANCEELAQPIPLSFEPSGDIVVAGYLQPEAEAVSLKEALRRMAGVDAPGQYAAAGRITASGERWIEHDATITGDAAGAVVLDLATGAAVGMHVGTGMALAAEALRQHAGGDRLVVQKARPQHVIEVRAEAVAAPEAPLTPADYVDREGYAPDFLGDDAVVRLPEPTNDGALKFVFDEKETTELKYMHFSVVMSEKRQLCLFSAVNIDGKTSGKSFPRAPWRRDPRIPDDAQIFGDVYGNAPHFSRGHMTRREDPIWGSTDDARVGNSDSMHFTNVAPQMQPFNAPVWLALEDYALKHARKDKMRISVFTGPFLKNNDPVRFDVKIPIEFWKVIAFIHDETGRLCCTGYTMSQEDFLSPLEFVFGEFQQAQIPVALIEKRAKLNFHGLAALDPLAGEESAYSPLTSLEEIRFTR